MIRPSRPSRQPKREPWTRERLLHERAIALGQAIDEGTWKNYGSVLNSYLSFVRMHDFPVNPTADTLSFFTVYMCHHIKPDSIATYLSGICQQLEPYFPDVRAIRKSTLVHRTLQGCMRLKGSPAVRKRALTLDNIAIVLAFYHDLDSITHDNLLFICMLMTGFFALMCLGELSFPDDHSLRDWRKVTKRSSVQVNDDHYGFFLPAHKANKFFEGNRIIICAQQIRHNPLSYFRQYLASRNRLFPLASPLWLTSSGEVPTRSFFIQHLRTFFDKDVAGQSMRASGATSLAENGTPPSVIQAIGRWASDTFQIYVSKSPVLIQALLFGRERANNPPLP
ncbi:hypothetical protein GALMADRAFT_61709 [Galerina marginata CBS 339.88]|uniref:Core-binding (CB) domain-containing protein n=1 Tax=Galerina marginata (strain CBS 339.88) TaxID=685588 RepID=A0A067T9G5_GALM3|nr:hypothetical protein GALMADRAFT_61709 [Galerina marginata CBS 339.88]